MANDDGSDKIGPFELKECLGRGESGVVYRVLDRVEDRVVAVKILPAEFLAEPDFLVRFEQETDLIKQLTHPAILPLLDSGEMEGQPYLVMPLMTNGSLAEKLAGEPLSLPEVLAILSPVVGALTEARSQGIVHGNLKPSNILFEGDTIRVADFGLPAVMAATAAWAGREVAGSPGYASPEQIRAERVDGRSDVYALGVIAYEALAGQPPFQAETAEGLMFLHAAEGPQPLDDLRPDLPRAVCTVVMRALAKLPDDRYPSVAVFLQSLAGATGLEPAGAPVMHPQKLAARKKQGNWKVWLGLGTAAAFVLMCVCPVLTTLVGPVNSRYTAARTPTRVYFTPTRTPILPSARVYYDRGYQQYKASNYVLAIDYFSRAIELDSDYQDAYYYRGRAYRGLKGYTRAIADYNTAIELEPDDSRVYNSRGNVHRDMGDDEQAIADYNQAIKLRPDYALAHRNLGEVYLDQGNYEQAIVNYSRAIELEPSNNAYHNRGICYLQLEDTAQAIADFTNAIELDPDNGYSYRNRGNAYRQSGDVERALADYDTAIELIPDSAGNYFARGMAYYDQGEYELAAADYSRAIEFNGDHALAHNNLAWTLAYHLDTEYERALEHAQQAVELGPTGANQDTLALVYFKLDQYDKALEHYSTALELDPEQAGSCKGRGDVYLAMGNEAAALADYEMYLSLVTEGPEREVVEGIVKSLRRRAEG